MLFKGVWSNRERKCQEGCQAGYSHHVLCMFTKSRLPLAVGSPYHRKQREHSLNRTPHRPPMNICPASPLLCYLGAVSRLWTAASTRLLVNTQCINFLCYVTKYHKLTGLKWHPFIISQFCKSGWFICSGSHKVEIKALAGCVLIWSSKSSSKFIQVGKFQIPLSLLPNGPTSIKKLLSIKYLPCFKSPTFLFLIAKARFKRLME